MSGFKTITTGPGFPEAPRWHDGRLWYVEFYSREVRRVSTDGEQETIATLDAMPGGLGWLPDGTPLVVSQNDFKIMRIGKDGKTSVHADLSNHCRGAANDMFVDANGRAYVGHHGFDFFGGAEPRPSSLLLVEPDGRVREVADELIFPNGIALLPGGGRLIVAESFANRLTAFDVGKDGSLSNRATFAELGDDTPDGICADAEGGVWFGSPMTARFGRVDKGGSLTDTIATENGRWAVACALGGDDGRTLFGLTAATTLDDMPQGKSDAFVEMTTVKVAGV
jgi:sugar lactone lactonase YvrE